MALRRMPAATSLALPLGIWSKRSLTPRLGFWRTPLVEGGRCLPEVLQHVDHVEDNGEMETIEPPRLLRRLGWLSQAAFSEVI